MQFLCQGVISRCDEQLPQRELNIGCVDQASNDYSDFFGCYDEVPVPSVPDSEAPRNTEIPKDKTDRSDLHRLFCFADTLSKIDSNLESDTVPALEVSAPIELLPAEDSTRVVHMVGLRIGRKRIWR